jgi:F-type H+-transporting ATPase subunit gamma
MSGKLSEVEGRIGTVRQLNAVISAMRGIAAARSREARARLDGVRAYASAVGTAIGTALGLASDRASPAIGGDRREASLLIVLCGQQGFAGSFNDRVLDKVAGPLGSTAAEVLLVGDRGAMVAAERGLAVSPVAPMVVHTEEVPSLANRITDALYQRLESNHATRVIVVHAIPGPSGSIEIVERTLLPFDFTRFHVTPARIPPIVTLPPEQLLDQLAEEYVYAELCAAVMLSYAAENEARMQAMIAARSNVERKLNELIGSYRTLRQEEITAEIIELSAGTLSGVNSAGRERPKVGATPSATVQ